MAFILVLAHSKILMKTTWGHHSIDYTRLCRPIVRIWLYDYIVISISMNYIILQMCVWGGKKPKAMWVGYIKDGHIIKGQFLPFIEKQQWKTCHHIPLHQYTHAITLWWTMRQPVCLVELFWIMNIHTCCNLQLLQLFMHLLQLNYLHTLQTIYTLTETLTL